jgi:adenosine kinase
MKKIYISGSVAYDEIMDFPHHFKDYFHPEKLHQINVSFAVSDLAKHLGGITTNITYALRNTMEYYNVISTAMEKSQRLRSLDSKKDIKFARDDTYAIYPVAAVGRDGDEILNFFKENNINTEFVQKDKKLYTATGKVITDKNNNQIWGFYYGAAKLNIQIDKYSNSQIKNKDDFWVIAATHEKPFATALRYVINNKIPYLFDPGMTLTWIKDALLKRGVMNARYVIGNDYEIAMIEKRLKITVRELVEKGVNVITTLGEKGVRFDGIVNSQMDKYSNKQIVSQSVRAVKVKKVVDPTGAGDAWRGGFVGALAAGQQLKDCLIMGNVMASFAVEQVGTVEYRTTKEEIGRRIKILNPKL